MDELKREEIKKQQNAGKCTTREQACLDLVTLPAQLCSLHLGVCAHSMLCNTYWVVTELVKPEVQQKDHSKV